MKRSVLAARVTYLAEQQQQLEEAARELVKAEQQNPVHRYTLDQARREHQRRALAFAIACIRYIGGKTK